MKYLKNVLKNCTKKPKSSKIESKVGLMWMCQSTCCVRTWVCACLRDEESVCPQQMAVSQSFGGNFHELQKATAGLQVGRSGWRMSLRRIRECRNLRSPEDRTKKLLEVQICAPALVQKDSVMSRKLSVLCFQFNHTNLPHALINPAFVGAQHNFFSNN